MIRDLFSNKILMSGIIAWAVAQAVKTILFTIVNRKFDASRIFGDGGFPSGHSATVTAVAISSAILYGAGSFQFAISCILAIIVMHDATGVRLETGKQAKIINDIIDFFNMDGKDLTDEEKLKELVGHTPTQVAAGFLLGVIVAVLVTL